MRLIDADDAIRKMENTIDMQELYLPIHFKEWVIDECPTIDAVPVVRCKDCKHKVTTEDGEYNPRDIVCDYWESDGLEETDFCSYGERRTE